MGTGKKKLLEHAESLTYEQSDNEGIINSWRTRHEKSNVYAETGAARRQNLLDSQHTCCGVVLGKYFKTILDKTSVAYQTRNHKSIHYFRMVEKGRGLLEIVNRAY